ncbi:MAG: DNA glycosylase AlkZ-like family protein, partial [Acidimicrobiales bacterium]
MLGEPAPLSVVGAARQVGGVQAQVMSSAELATGVRTGHTPATVSDALWVDRTLVKTWAMRGTLHLLPADEPGLAEIVRASFGGSILKPAAADGSLCFAPDRGRNVTFVDPKAWLGGEPDPDTAMAVVARRFFDAYGPATVDDFGRWWGVSAADAKRLLRPLVDDMVTVDLDGLSALVTPEGAEGLAAAKALRGHVRLLPAFDTYVLAPRSHRSHAWPDGLHARISRPAGWITPVLLVDGCIAGVWAHERTKGTSTFEVEALVPPPVLYAISNNRCRESLRERKGSAGEDGPGHEVGAEGGEDGQVEQAGGGHHRRVGPLLEGGVGDPHENDRAQGTRHPEPAEGAVPPVVDRSREHREHARRPD